MSNDESALNVSVVERLTEQDKAAFDLVKMKRELAQAKAEAAHAQLEAANMSCSNVVLQFAMRYKLVDGDVINEDGTIKRI